MEGKDLRLLTGEQGSQGTAGPTGVMNDSLSQFSISHFPENKGDGIWGQKNQLGLFLNCSLEVKKSTVAQPCVKLMKQEGH